MTVEELIEELKLQPKDQQVLAGGTKGDHYHLGRVYKLEETADGNSVIMYLAFGGVFDALDIDKYYGRYLGENGRLINLCNDHLVAAVKEKTVVGGWSRCVETPGSFDLCTCGLGMEWKHYKFESTLKKDHYRGYDKCESINDTDHCDLCEAADLVVKAPEKSLVEYVGALDKPPVEYSMASCGGYPQMTVKIGNVMGSVFVSREMYALWVEEEETRAEARREERKNDEDGFLD